MYGELTTHERLLLDTHVAQCPGCRAAMTQLRTVTEAPVSPTPALDVNLLPRIHDALERQPRRAPWYVRKPVIICCMALMIAGAYAIASGMFAHTPPSGDVVAEAVVGTPVQMALTEAEALVGLRDYPRAYAVLSEAVAAHPADAYAGEAQARLAGIAYSDLKWYPEAYEAYGALARKYPALAKEAVAVERRDVLAEARVQDYAPLYALDAARRNEADQFAQLEQVVARYPKTFVAGAAASDMARIAAGASSDALAAMEMAKSRCTNAIAVARLNVEIGHIYLRQRHDPERAKAIYQEAADSANPDVAELAKGALARLEAK